jgi:glycosyltransferase involved in cell wall biosynthesis
MVARVIFPFRGAELGGSHVATFTLGGALQRNFPIECVVLCPPDTLIMEEAQRLGFRIVSSGEAPTGRNNVVTDYSRLARRRRILARERTKDGAVVHCNDINSLRAWGYAARLCGMGVVYHHHALNRMMWPPHLLSLGSANAIICVSDSTRAAMRTIRPDAIKELNPFDLDDSTDRAAARAALLSEFGWPGDARVVGWIGNFWERKRPGFFLETAVELARRDPKTRFVMFGRDGDWSVDQVRRRAESLGIGALVAMPGFRQPVEANLAPLDLLLAPAPREPFGRALVEAIVLGTPIVATEGAGHSEIIGAWGGGELARGDSEVGDVAALCMTVLANADRYRAPPARRRQIAAELAPDAYAARILRVYERITRSPPSSQAAAPAAAGAKAVR